ncbi:PadR family transcriptional regulator [Agromyces intestinalis]|uniref:PadR family transcriptional regulator n=1 Tax=Agromyces intestinalis TaxID=2592652 RepID=UPI001AEFB4A5|nr:helix-turn-helix transcriptional regulator [Agromyces intestinalis]
MTSARHRLQRADRDLAALAVLALLTQGPRHPYDLHRFMIDTRKDFVTGLPRSIYHAVDKLARDGLIAVHGSEQQAGRPERTTYELTDAGRAELRRRVSLLLATPESDATLSYAALSFMGALTRDDALVALRARIAALDVQRATLAADLAEASGVPPILLVESRLEQARLDAERSWFAGLVDDLESGELAWLDTRA